jgi:uncharacterized membrane protein
MRAPLNDRRIEQIIGRMLQIGVLVAAAVVSIGGIALLSQHGGSLADFRSFHPEPRELHTLPGIWDGARSLDSRAIVQFGLVLLIATPVVRVGLTLVAFVHQRDWFYVATTALVLTLLAYGLVWGQAL